MEYPNKTYVLDQVIDSDFGKRHHVVIVVAKNKTVAQQHLKKHLGWKGHENELTWLMNTDHTTLYDQTGNKPLEVQAKIQYNSTTSIDVKSSILA